MTLNARRRRVHDKLAALPGVRSVRRPVAPDSDERFDLFYVRSGPQSEHPLVIIPGGPGVASIQLYKGFRRRAAARGLDVIMMEHRGVGMSRHDDSGADLPPESMTVGQVVDDVAAVLDDAGVATAIPYGTSYGTYIAAGLGVRHRDRVHAMVLDSPVLSASDIEAVRAAVRGVLLDGADSDTSDLAAKVRRLVDDGVMTPAAGQIATVIYGFGGAELLDRQLDLLLSGRTLLWRAIDQIGKLTLRKAPYRNEVDLVGRIAFRELDYVGEPDGLPLDPSEVLQEMAQQIAGPTPAFEAEPYDLVAEMPRFDWSTAVISGGRDLTTPPAVAERVASLIPDAALVRLPTAGHSALDTRERAAMEIAKAVTQGETAELPARGDELDALPGNPAVRLLVSAVAAAAAIEGAVPKSLADLPGLPGRSAPTA
ncbi:alpha/beta hydrolase [Mycolicibacterium komossense]|uniref:Alpha/beta fold hydrolase n=1 Tax=Mycolicibacterium komossense TaxID=1779 RepID=A0ABT3CK28_9MYCO|nr:alpha/beta hydrolase [Mycolicibacterium komossense]MCV7229777.1 alpha/beta fold hydrolase [Mycolicibacterium komossense]